MVRVLILMSLGLTMWLSAARARAQADTAAIEAGVDAARRTDLRVIVLDADGRPAEGAEVRVEQVQHAFPLGVVLPAGGHAGLVGYDPEAPLWRVFSAVSLERLTGWGRLQPRRGDFDWGAVPLTVDWAETFGLHIHWGGILSADPVQQPDWAVELGDADPLDAAADYLDVVLFNYGERMASADLYTDGLRQPWLTASGRRWLFDHTRLAAPALDLRLRFEQALEGGSAWQMLRSVQEAEQAFIDADGVSLDHRFLGRATPDAVEQTLLRLEGLDTQVIVSALEIGGETSFESAINLQRILERLFSQPNVHGIYLDAAVPDSATGAHTALADATGAASPVGLAVDALFRQRWWTREAGVADLLGNAGFRVFAGTYRITAVLPDGSELEADVAVPKSDEERVVVMEPLW